MHQCAPRITIKTEKINKWIKCNWRIKKGSRRQEGN
jgi:hypothetical protein